METPHVDAKKVRRLRRVFHSDPVSRVVYSLEFSDPNTTQTRACIACCFRLYCSIKVYQTGDVSYYVALAGVCAATESTIGFICACLPVFPRFFKTKFPAFQLRSTSCPTLDTNERSQGGTLPKVGGKTITVITGTTQCGTWNADTEIGAWTGGESPRYKTAAWKTSNRPNSMSESETYNQNRLVSGLDRFGHPHVIPLDKARLKHKVAATIAPLERSRSKGKEGKTSATVTTDLPGYDIREIDKMGGGIQIVKSFAIESSSASCNGDIGERQNTRDFDGQNLRRYTTEYHKDVETQNQQRRHQMSSCFPSSQYGFFLFNVRDSFDCLDVYPILEVVRAQGFTLMSGQALLKPQRTMTTRSARTSLFLVSLKMIICLTQG